MPAPKVTVYTKHNCPYCLRAKRLLEKKGVAFEEVDVEGDDSMRIWLAEKSGQKTVPQVFVGERSLGGYSDLDALERDGKLDAILAGPRARRQAGRDPRRRGVGERPGGGATRGNPSSSALASGPGARPGGAAGGWRTLGR